MKPQLELFSVDVSGPNMIRGAVISECGTYRYKLWRMWRPKDSHVLFIALNPSTADGTVEDNTTRRMMHFARSWGFGGYVLVNLFAYRATFPEELKEAEDPVGPDNDQTIIDELGLASWVVPCWGTHGGLLERDKEVVGILKEFEGHIGKLFLGNTIPPAVKCFGFTKGGYPKHPLYLSNDTEPVDFIVIGP